MFHTVQSGDTLYGIARKYNLSASDLRKINNLSNGAILSLGQVLRVKKDTPPPSVSSGTAAPDTNQEYTVQTGDTLYGISKKFGIPPTEILKMNGLSANSGIYIGQKLKIKPERITTPNPPKSKKVQTYTVKSGDSLFKIAKMFGVTPVKLLDMNNLAANASIYIGQTLKVAAIKPSKPVSSDAMTQNGTDYYTVSHGDSLIGIAQKFKTTPQQILKINGFKSNATIYIGQQIRVPAQKKSAPAPVTVPVSNKVHTVRTGEWLAKIAKEYNVSPEDIIQINNIKGNSIYVGQKLIIPTQSKKSFPPHLKAKGSAIVRARQVLQLQRTDGKLLFGKGLRGSISLKSPIFPEDLQKVQTRLVQLKALSPNHNEDPSKLYHITGGEIWGNNIPKTLTAIRRFQEKYRLNWWVGSTARCEMMGTDKFTLGAVEDGDITYRYLKDFSQFKLTFPHPVTKELLTVEYKNFVRSGYNQFYDGVGYSGFSSADDVPVEVFRSVGLDENLALAVRYVSKHEGNFDAINSYDKAFFSYGFIQFAGGGRGFGPLLARMKVSQPQLFKTYFQDLGIDVTYTTRGGDIHKGDLQLFDVHASQGEYEVSGITAEKALRADHQLYGAFIRAAYHPDFIKCQIEQAVKAYVKPALGIKLNFFNQTNVPITDVINSPMGLGFAIDMTVNKWINKTAELFEGGIERVARKHGLSTLEQIKRIDERAVIQSIIDHAGSDQRIVTRGNSIMHGTLSSAKRPNGGAGLLLV